MNTTGHDPANQPYDIVQVLAHHYGDGAVYVPREAACRDALRRAIAAGFVSVDGFITRKGRHLLAHSEFPDLRG